MTRWLEHSKGRQQPVAGAGAASWSPGIRAGVLIALVVATFVFRAERPVSRPQQWMKRAAAFSASVGAHRWGGTYQSYHPGFTTMAIGAVSLWAYDALAGSPGRKLFEWADFPYATPRGRRVAAAVMGLAAAHALLLLASVAVLAHLGGWNLALAGGGLLAFAPFVLAESRIMHVDGLLGALMLLSVLLLLLGLERERSQYLIASGFVGGLALLTKTPAAFLVPFAVLCVGTRAAVDWRRGRMPGRVGWRGWWQRAHRDVLRPLMLWLAAAAAAFLLWPAIWVQPLAVVHGMIDGVRQHVSHAHANPVFFAGRLYHGTPPDWRFYPVTVAFDCSFITTVLALLGFGPYLIWPRRLRPPLPPWIFCMLLAYVVFFTLQMSLGAKQVGGRYLLPVHFVLQVVAAVGLTGIVELLLQSQARHRETMAMLVACTAVGLQVLVALTYAPDYGAHHNHLLGGNRVAARLVAVTDQNEGLSAVAAYLNRQPHPDALRVAATDRAGHQLRQYFSGQIVPYRGSADYALFDLGTIQRRIKPQQWSATLERYRGHVPAMVASFDGIEFFWLHTGDGHEPPAPVLVQRGWEGWIATAWVWTALLIGTALWAWRRGDEG